MSESGRPPSQQDCRSDGSDDYDGSTDTAIIKTHMWGCDGECQSIRLFARSFGLELPSSLGEVRRSNMGNEGKSRVAFLRILVCCCILLTTIFTPAIR